MSQDQGDNPRTEKTTSQWCQTDPCWYAAGRKCLNHGSLDQCVVLMQTQLWITWVELTFVAMAIGDRSSRSKPYVPPEYRKAASELEDETAVLFYLCDHMVSILSPRLYDRRGPVKPKSSELTSVSLKFE